MKHHRTSDDVNDLYEFAFPRPDERAPDGSGIMQGSHGMTLRDWFAGQALAGIMSATADGATISAVARDAYAVADEMMKRRKEGRESRT